MTRVVAVLAVVVGGMYGYIAFGVVPRLVRGHGSQERLLTMARWGAVLFFAGCAMTHLGMAVGMLLGHGGHGQQEMAEMSWPPLAWIMEHQDLVSHLIQLVGGTIFIGIAGTRLELSVMGRRDAEQLRVQEARFRAAFQQAPLGVALVATGGSSPGQLLAVNPALTAMLGFERDEDLLTQDYLDLISPPDRHLNVEGIARLGAGASVVEEEVRVLHRDGREITVRARACLVCEDGEAPFIVAQVHDITQEREHEARLRFLATHDTLTGVLNRHQFKQELDRLIDTDREDCAAALLVVDLDQFKYVNDAYGHSVGDQMLVAVADAVQRRLRATDLVGRLGGDQFGVLCTSIDHDAARTLAHDLMRAVHDDARVTVPGGSVRAAASIGVTTICPGLATGSDQLMAEADLAMYEAKQAGRERVSVTQPGGHTLDDLRSQLAGADHIRRALDEDRFRLWEQPILNLGTGETDRSELLVRMVDPHDGSIVLPGRFLPAAERFGQIQAIDRWVFAQAVDLLSIRLAAGDQRAVGINLSGASLTDEALIDDLSALIQAAPIDPSRLIVEITETAAIRNFDLAQGVAERLSRLGCRFALDDFGAGFGSFYYLKHLPFHEIKIDGEFVKDLPTSPSDRFTVEAMVTLAQKLNKKITAEFVQNAETVTWLRDLGVDHAQGYYIGHPREITELTGQPLLDSLRRGQ